MDHFSERIEFISLGETNEIGANSFYLGLGGTGIILDAGLHPLKSGTEALPDISLISDKQTDYLFISHAHHDHIGALPHLIKYLPHLKIFTTPSTREIARKVLHNSVEILKKRGENGLKPLTHDEIDLLLKSVEFYEYEENFQLEGLRHFGKKINAKLFNAGHILGSAGILIEYGDKKIFYTGDMKSSEQKIMSGAHFPRIKVDTLIIESTYAADNSEYIWKEEEKIFTKELNRVLSNNGSVLIPVFSLGKSQEILGVIGELIEKTRIINAPIFTGGLGKKIEAFYDKYRYKVKRNNTELVLRKIPQNNIYSISNYNYFNKKPSVVLAPGGMMMKETKSFDMMKHWVKYPENAIFFVGYLSPETPGYKILNRENGDKVKFDWLSKEIEVKCNVKYFNFKSHSSLKELLHTIKNFNPDKVIIVHGDDDARKSLGNEILKKYNHIKVYSPDKGERILI